VHTLLKAEVRIALTSGDKVARATETVDTAPKGNVFQARQANRKAPVIGARQADATPAIRHSTTWIGNPTTGITDTAPGVVHAATRIAHAGVALATLHVAIAHSAMRIAHHHRLTHGHLGLGHRHAAASRLLDTHGVQVDSFFLVAFLGT